MSDAIRLDIQDGIARLIFDLPQQKINMLSTSVMIELEKHIETLSTHADVKALIFQSAKASMFIAGADINEIANIENSELAMTKAGAGQNLMNKIEDLPFPTIAFIGGAAMGGGLELALACDVRIAGIVNRTMLGLPETQLGIIPGFGGTYRLPRLVGLIEAAKMIISGKAIDAKKAARIKLVDASYPIEFLEDWGMRFVQKLIKKPDYMDALKRTRRKKKFGRMFSEDFFLGRGMVIRALRKNVRKKTGGQYPALLAAIRVLRRTANVSRKRALQIELNEFSKLAPSLICKNLVSLFFAQERIKKQHRLSHASSIHIRKAAVLGAGTMGGKIAWLFSKKDIPVIMKDINWDAIHKGYAEAKSVYDTLLQIRKIDTREINLGMHKISGAVEYASIRNADFIVEAIFENMDLKKKVLRELEKHISSEALIVSNTSALSIDELASALKHPKRFCGMHFFNPVNRMPLVEIIVGKRSSVDTIGHVVHAAVTLGKVPIVVKNCAGFLVNRLLMPYLNESVHLLEDGTNMHTLDTLVKKWGMPMGPIALLDEIGIDVAHKVAHTLNDAYGQRMSTGILFSKIKEYNEDHQHAALFGKKSGAGFYRYGKRPIPNPSMVSMISRLPRKSVSVSHDDILDRLIYMMVNEAARTLEESVVGSAWELDLALIMGIGFPPFRGGLMKWVDTMGIRSIYDRLQSLRDKYGHRFEPSPLITRLAQEGRTFYDAYAGT